MSVLAAFGRCCLLALVPAWGAASVQVAPDSSAPEFSVRVGREWQVRSWALDPATSAAALREALLAADWQVRFDALDALARSHAGLAWCRADGDQQRVVARVADPHPNVRAQAIELVARAGLFARAMSEHGDGLLLETFPPAQIALANAWSFEPTCVESKPSADGLRGRAEQRERIWSRLAEWERSSDPALAHAAFSALVAGGLRAPEQIIDWLLDVPVDGQFERWLAGLESLERGGPGAQRPGKWRAALARRSRPVGVRATFELQCARRGWSDGLEAIEPDLAPLSTDPAWNDVLATTARVHPQGLGQLLWRVVLEGGSDAQWTTAARTSLIECAAQASKPWVALEHARSLDAAGVRTTWEAVAMRIERWDEQGGEYWLAAERDTALRFLALRALGRTALNYSSPAAIDNLLRLAVDPERELREFAFQALSDLPAVGAQDTRLRSVWSTYDRAEQLESLRVLPRSKAPLAFRADLLRLAAVPSTRSTSVLELLGLFGPDAQIADAAEAWLGEALDALADTRAADTRFRVRERLARSLLQALLQLRDDGALEALSMTLRRGVSWVGANPGHSLKLAEVAARALGATPAGRVLLSPYMEAGPRLVRVEAALAFAAQDGAASGGPAVGVAQRFLAQSFDDLSSEHRTRALKACGQGRGGEALGLLERVADDSGQAWEQRFAALDGLARHGQLERLQAVFAAATEVEVRVACLGAIASIPGDGARSFLAEQVDRTAAVGLAPGPMDLDHVEAALLIDEALSLLAGRAELDPERAALWLVRARATAAGDLEARFAERSLARPDFRWRAELTLARRLSAAGQLDTVLQVSDAWEWLDAELLHALAESVQGDSRGRVAAGFYRAALVAYAGQPATVAVRGHILECQLRLVGLCEELDLYDEMATWCDTLRRADVGGEDVAGLLERRWGALDLDERTDPRARLAAAAYQARALAALERGERAQAEAWAAGARALIGSSARASSAQTRIEGLVSSPRPR